MPVSVNLLPYKTLNADSLTSPPIPLFYRYSVADDSLMAENDILFRPSTEEVIVQPWGKPPRPIPAEQKSADVISTAILMSFVLVMIILRYHRPPLHVAWKDFLFSKNTKLLSQTEKSREEKLRIVMTLLISLQGAIATLVYAPDNLLLTTSRSSWLVFGVYMLAFFALFVFKQTMYRFVHAVFFTRAQRELWLHHYSFLFALESVLLFPITTVFIELHLDYHLGLNVVIVLLLIVKISLLFKCFSTFFDKSYGLLHLFVYFCALEAAPLVVLWALLMYLLNNLTIL